MRNLLMSGLAVSSFICGASRAETSASDEILANAALSELHSLAVASTKLARATKDDDNLGCRYAYANLEEAAHTALEDMHHMSFVPIDSLQFVSELLRLEHIAQPNGCYFESSAYLLPLTAGQAIMALRWDYAIGDDDWYVIETNGEVVGKNPLRYHQSLKERDYSWVITLPRGMVVILERDWKSEMSSNQVDDFSIENSGNNVQNVEVDYRKNPEDEVTEVYFYRSKEAALAVVREEAARKASELDWKQKLASLSFIIANQDVGFKLIYAVCKLGDTNEKGATCNTEDSHDWSDDPHTQYRWFSSIKECDDQIYKIHENHPSTVKLQDGDFFTSDCVPAPKIVGRTLKGYRMAVSISSPDPLYGQVSYVDLRRSGSDKAIVFDTFKGCNNNVQDMYSKIERYLNIDENGMFLSDKNKSITAMVNCVRVY